MSADREALASEDRRLAALAATLLPERARVLLARGPFPVAADEAARLAALPRGDRLAALAGALALELPAARVTAAAAAERPAVASLLRCVATRGAAFTASAALLRLCRERLGGPDDAP